MDIHFKRKKHIAKKVHGFLHRMASGDGRAVIKRRRLKGRKRLTV